MRACTACESDMACTRGTLSTPVLVSSPRFRERSCREAQLGNAERRKRELLTLPQRERTLLMRLLSASEGMPFTNTTVFAPSFGSAIMPKGTPATALPATPGGRGGCSTGLAKAGGIEGGLEMEGGASPGGAKPGGMTGGARGGRIAGTGRPTIFAGY